MNRVHMIGSTHFDPVWLWTWDEGLASIRSTFRAALDRMDEDPEFIYSFSCPPVFKQLDEVDPELMSRIEGRIKEGRWALDEGLWVQPDCFSACVESYIRQCLHAQRYLMERFGRMSDTVFNTDTFGHPHMLPQVYRKCGLNYSVICRPEKNDLDLGDPCFRWTAPDGSEMLVAHAGQVGGTYDVGEAQIGESLKVADGVGHHVLMIYGVSNHGGAPTKRSLAAIHQVAQETGGRVLCSNTTDFFRSIENTDLPVHCDEIPISSFGVFACRPDVKQANRQGEYALANAERAAFFAQETGAADRTGELAGLWQTLLYNQFHDILGGAALNDSYRDTAHDLGACMHGAGQMLHLSLQRMTKDIDLSNPDAPDAAWSLVAWNLNGQPYRGWVEAEVQWAWEFDWYRGELCVTDEQGNDIPCQKILPRAVFPGFRSRFVFYADIPAMGWRTYRVRQRACALPAGSDMSVSERELTDGRIRVSLDEAGAICEVRDLASGRVLLSECARPVAVKDGSDIWAFNFTGYGEEEHFALESVRVYEQGPLRVRLKARYRLRDSWVEQSYILYRDTGMVDGRIRVQWNEKYTTLKLRFRGGENLTAATPGFGVKRKWDGRELPCGGWADLTQADGSGALILTDCFYSFDTTADGVLRATVLRSPIVGDLHMEDLPEDDYEYMSNGIFEGRWRVVSHGAQNEDFAWSEAEAFSNPPVIVDEAAHPGTQPLCGSFAAIEAVGAARITALKRAEDGTGDAIVRLQNHGAEKASMQLSLIGCDRLETELNAYEIRTMRCGKSGWREVSMLEE